MRALVTGATGFVGRALSGRLLGLGEQVRVLARDETKAADLAANGATVLRGELGDPNAIAEAAGGCDLLFHCAGETDRHADAERLAWINVAGTENVINAARHAGVAAVVILSCADATLLNADRLSWKEGAVLGQEPLGAFARSRLLAEELALQTSDARTRVAALRPGYVWGPGDRATLDALRREVSTGGVRLYGGGENLLATLYIDNLVDALLAAASALRRGDDAAGRAFHVNDPDHLTANEFFSMLCRALSLPPPRRGVYALSHATALVRRALGRPGPWPEDVARRGRGSLLDCLAAATILGFEPKVTSEQGEAALAGWAAEADSPPASAATAQ